MLSRNTRFPRSAWWSQAESNRRPLTGHLMEVPRAMIRLENAEPGSLGSTIVAARLPSRAHDATDPADRRTGNEWEGLKVAEGTRQTSGPLVASRSILD